ncbi:MAG TPA: phenylalanine--tRNA ligase subunit beta [Acidimicrobiia bacterium]|nr:phenylalanine--tRNA ligase subunit beta [Acidimicrobiia bacterium]
MKASLRWIQEFVDLPTDDPHEVAAVLDALGIEVESVERLDVPFSGVVVARVDSVAPHPDADRLRVVGLDAGGERLEVVCGAWNFDAGAIVAYARVGSVLAGGLEVGEREIRGVMSPGMIASEKELGIGEDADGILVLDGDAVPGEDLAAMLPYPDAVFDLSITPNRPDAMSIHGIARDLGAYYDVPVRAPDPTVTEAAPPTRASVRIEEPDRCPRFTAREVRGVEIGPSPLWMRDRLRRVGIRPINNVVDVSNYVMVEYGQPLHAFDLDRIPDETIVVRRARAGETLTTLDGVERPLHEDDLLIAGPEEPLGLAGIMGGEDSEVSETTTRVLIEVAHFEPGGVLLTGKRHGIRSEAVSRFERGVDPELPPIASARAAALIAELAGGEVAAGFVDEYPRPWTAPVVSMSAGEPERLLGIPIEASLSAAYLERLGFRVSGDDPLEAEVPSYRPDVTRAVDLVEEVARIHGYDKIPATTPFGTAGILPDWLRRERRLREILVGAGYFEVWNFDFMSIEAPKRLGIPEGDRRRTPVEVRNPLSDEQRHLRTTLLPGLLEGVAFNQARHIDDVSLFEIGTVFYPSDGDLPDQPHRLGFVAAGRVPGPSWEARAERDARDAAGLVETLFGALGRDMVLEQAAEPGFHPGRCARVIVDGEAVGVVGEVHPAAAEDFGVAGRVAAGELDLGAMVRVAPVFELPSAYPPVVFDLAFDLPGDAAAGPVGRSVREAAGTMLEKVEIFDVFRGPPLDPDRASVAFRLTFRAPDRTLTDEELVPVREAIVALVASRHDGRLRGG